MPRSRISVSWIAPFSACPMCSAPVTLGGGTAIVYGGRSEYGSAANAPAASHSENTRGSTAAGSKRLRSLSSSPVGIAMGSGLY